MKFRRITSVLLAGIMAVSLLTGCGINKDATVAKDDIVTINYSMATSMIWSIFGFQLNGY